MDRIIKGLKKMKGKLIFAVVLLLVITIVFVTPLSVAIKNAMETGVFDFEVFWGELSNQISNPMNSIGKALSFEYIGTFWSVFWKFTLIYLVAIAIGLYKVMPKHEYSDIEHGSSDWSDNGEQYKILSKNKGLLLAQKNYLPLNKRGNINVLVVGRFWFW